MGQSGRLGLSRLMLVFGVILCCSDLLETDADYMVIPALNTEYPFLSPISYQVPLVALSEAPPTHLPVWTQPGRAAFEKQFVSQQQKPPLQNYGAPINHNHNHNVNPEPNYGPPAQSYGAPNRGNPKPIDNYGPPAVIVSTPVPVPSAYGPPKTSPLPAIAYGAPEIASSPAPAYGALPPFSDIEDNAITPLEPVVTGLGLLHSAKSHHFKALGSPLVAQLRERIQHLTINPYYTTDRMLARYIESSNYSLEKALILLERTARWRHNNNIDYILDWSPPAVLSKNFPYECTGFTDEGLPVIYLPIGKWNFKAVRQAGLGSQISKYFTRMLEDIRNLTVGRKNPKTGEPVDQVVIVENLNGFRLSTYLTIRNNYIIIVKRYLRNFDRHFPFLAKRYIALRAPLAVQLGWTLYRRTTPRLRNTLQVYNRFSIRGPDDLFHTVPKYAIPTELGGAFISTVAESSDSGEGGYGVEEQVW